MSPIPFSEMSAYLDCFGVEDLDERERWIRMISAIDDVYVRRVNDRLRRERDAAKRKVQRPRTPRG